MRFNQDNGEYNIGGLRCFKMWAPYFNLRGRYVGCAFGQSMVTGETEYYNPKTKEIVQSYDELDW